MQTYDIKLLVFFGLVVQGWLLQTPAQNKVPLPPSEQEQKFPQVRVVLKAGTPVQLRLAETLDTSRIAEIEQGVEFEVFEEVKIGDLVVIPRSAYAWGSAETKAKRAFGTGATLKVFAVGAYAINGNEIPLGGDTAASGGPGCYAEGCVGFLLFPWLKGEDVHIPKGTKVQAYTQRDVSFDAGEITKAMAEWGARKALKLAGHRGKALVHIYRSADGDGGKAIVYIDGKEVARFEQNRFLTLQANPGKHSFRVGKKNETLLDVGDGQEHYVRASKKSRRKPIDNAAGEEEIYPLESLNPVDGYKQPQEKE